MIKIGITGGIGSGKTTVCRIFELFGVFVFYSDAEAKIILENDIEVKNEIINCFGKKVMNNAGMVDRNKLGEIVFRNKENLEKLNSIVHPIVGRHFETWCKINRDKPYILKEAAILFESNAYKQVDKIITVTAPIELRIKRAMERDNISREQVIQRMDNQMTDEEKVKRGWYEIYNDDEHLLMPQVVKIHTLLIS